ncbi:MAG: hypothetical protein D6722_21350, partial [Bacteroidetes bacterium]
MKKNQVRIVKERLTSDLFRKVDLELSLEDIHALYQPYHLHGFYVLGGWVLIIYPGNGPNGFNVLIGYVEGSNPDDEERYAMTLENGVLTDASGEN